MKTISFFSLEKSLAEARLETQKEDKTIFWKVEMGDRLFGWL